MLSPNSPVLRQLHCLDLSSPDFQDQLSEVLYGEQYIQCEKSLEHGDLIWLVDYLDQVSRRVAPSRSPLKST